MPKHTVPLHEQKLGIIRAIEEMEKTAAARIARKETTKEKADRLNKALEAALETLGGLCERIDMRETLN